MAIGSYAIGAAPVGAAHRRIIIVPVPLQVVGVDRLLASFAKQRIMNLAEPFAPIEVGEIDYFVFDFTCEVGNEDIVTVYWSCRLTPFSIGADPAAGSRVPAGPQLPAHAVYQRSCDGSLTQRTGYFGIAPVGPMPASAAGATYIIGAMAYLSGGTRRIALNSTVQCVLPGQ
jgi:hypothetical protein